MTESEFQECIIKLGYRYHEKTQTAFNSFEGFHCLIEFGLKDNRYLLTMDCSARSGEGLSAITERLKQYQTEHKNNVIKAVCHKKTISVILKMTIDSSIDQDELKELTRLMTELCKSGHLAPICRVCARERKTGLYVVGKDVTPLCDACVTRKRRLYDKRVEMFTKKKQNMPGGLIGAVFGAAFGGALYVLLYQLLPHYGIAGMLIAVFSFAGFVVTGNRATKKSAVICEIISCIVFFLAEYLGIVFNTAIDIEREGGGIAISEAIDITNSSFSDTSILWTLIPELAIGLGLIVMVGIAYFIKRCNTRPTKISKNIL